MHALIDLSWMVPGHTGGIEVQMRAFVETLLRLDSTNRYTILLPCEVVCDFDLEGHPNVRVLAADGPRHYAERAAWFLFRRKRPYRSPLLARLARETDVVCSVGGYALPEFAGIPRLVIVGDIQHEYMPEFFAPHELAKLRETFRSALASAARVVAVSEFTRQTLIERLDLDPGLVRAAPLAVHPSFEPYASGKKALPDVLGRYGIQPGYLYYPANTWPHKNHKKLLEALSILEGEGLRPHLVCTGAPKGAHAEILEQVRQLGLSDRVHFLGYCEFEEIPAFYAQAAALVFPSLFEGFGMPVLEAMAMGCPAACSRATSLPEIGGEAALYFDPQDPLDIARALRALLTRADLRQELASRGRERARCFSWDRHTRILLSALEGAAGQPGTRWDEVPEPDLTPAIPGAQARARALLLRARREPPARAFLTRIESLLVSPRVFFYAAFFPALRDALLRGRLGRMI